MTFSYSNYEQYVSEDGRSLIDIPEIFLHGAKWMMERNHLFAAPAPIDENKLQQEAEEYANAIYPDHLFTLKKDWEKLVECYKVAAQKHSFNKNQVASEAWDAAVSWEFWYNDEYSKGDGPMDKNKYLSSLKQTKP
jgi:hypothetical protein